MDLFVVSRSRFEKSDTLEYLAEAAKDVKLVVPTDQLKQYKTLAKKYNCELVGCPDKGIALTRKFCGIHTTKPKFLMLDDDLKFYRRISPTDTRLRYLRDLEGATITQMLSLVSEKLSEFSHVAISAREGNNRLPYEGVTCNRPLRALAYVTKEFNALEHGRVKIMEDFDVTLQLLKAGHPNFIIAEWSQGQLSTGEAGGCSDYRTLELHNNEVAKMEELHRPFIKLRQKKNKTGHLRDRMEVIIYWKKAYESSFQ